MRRLLLGSVTFVLLSLSISAQEPAKPAPQLSPVARLRAAKTAYLKNGGGSDFPYKLFESSMEGWGRLTLVGTPEKADIVIEITSPTTDSGISVTSGTTRDNPLGGSAQSVTTSKSLSVQNIVVTVSDPRTNVRLWFASERPKGAMKQKAREDNLVAATQSLFSKFHDLVEPAPAP